LEIIDELKTAAATRASEMGYIYRMTLHRQHALAILAILPAATYCQNNDIPYSSSR
jgi:hypothetical protein